MPVCACFLFCSLTSRFESLKLIWREVHFNEEVIDCFSSAVLLWCQPTSWLRKLGRVNTTSLHHRLQRNTIKSGHLYTTTAMSEFHFIILYVSFAWTRLVREPKTAVRFPHLEFSPVACSVQRTWIRAIEWMIHCSLHTCAVIQKNES